MIIERSEVKSLQKIPKWTLLFGRRKTGKTFIARNFLKHDEYFFVKNNKNILSGKDSRELSYDVFLEIVRERVQNEKIVIIDEFQRLGSDFLDFLHYLEKKGRIILLSSTLSLSKNILGSKSPLLGLFAEFPLGIISLQDVLKALQQHRLRKKELLEFGVLLREPITAEYINEKGDVRTIIAEAISQSSRAIPAMIGEIFDEEGKQTSAVYEGILRAVAGGKTVSTEIASQLFSKRLIPKDDPSVIQQYLKNLVEFGILRRIKVFEKQKFVYKHASPLARLFYYADEKYNISERTATTEELRRIVEEIIPKIIEDAVRESLAEKFGLQEMIYEAKDYDVDACLVRFQKVEIAVEVKWTESIGEKEIRGTEEKLGRSNPKRKILFVIDKEKIKMKVSNLEVMDVTDL